MDERSETLRRQRRFEAYSEHRALLFSIAYRMLGSAADAEDMLHETFLQWQEAPDEEIRSLGQPTELKNRPPQRGTWSFAGC
ncbi:MAG: hypothetical protein JO249_19430 [Acidobacteria bacterium]|nr:hypothetical protein [Acidobacteriota bacterium]